MSKKSRRRNKKILATIAALGGAAMLANRRRDNSIAANEAKEAGFGTEKDFKETIVAEPIVAEPIVAKPKVYQDDIMRGGKGTKYQKPNLKFGQVINKKGDVQTLRPFENSGLTLGVSNRNVNKTQAAVNKANREMSKGMLPPQLRNPGRTNITTAQGKNRQFLADIGNFFLPKANFKSGGKVTKRKGAAKRGFGRAFKGGK